MKKVYAKPEIMFESFTLSTNIAGDCEARTNNPSNSTCAMDFSGYSLFLDTIDACGDIRVSTDENGDGFYGSGEDNAICYHVPYGNNLFNS